MKNCHFFKFCRYFLLVVVTMHFSVAGAQHGRYSQKRAKSPVVSLEHVLQNVDGIYNRNPVATNPLDLFSSTNDSIANYVTKVKPALVAQLQEHYYDAFYDASENEKLELAVDLAFKYIMVGGKKDEQVFWQLLVENYATDGDTDNTKFLLDCFKNISEQKENVYSESIAFLEKKYDDVIHPISFEEAAIGCWISLKDKTQLKKKKEMLTPDFFFTLINLNSEKGCIMDCSPIYQYDNVEKYKLSTCQALFCDADKKYVRMVFGSEMMNLGKEKLAHQMLDNNRQWKADMYGRINSSDLNLGEHVGAVAVTSLVGALFDGLATSTGASSKEGEAYEVELKGISPAVMDANISYRKVKLNSFGYTETKKSIPNQKYTFVKWEPTDSVIFIANDEKPIVPFFINQYDKDEPLLKEYNDIRNRYNPYRKPGFMVADVLSWSSFLFCYTCGAIQFSKCIKYLGDKHYDEDKAKKYGIQGCIWFGCGLVPVLIMIPIENHYAKKRRQALNELNERSMAKMRQKAAMLSMQPAFDPVDNAVGMNFHLTF